MKFFTAIGLVVLGLSISSAHAQGQNKVGVNAGMSRGGFTLGGEYEYLPSQNYGFGGYARFFQRDTNPAADGLFIFGGQARVHHNIEQFDLSVAPGFAIINVDPAGAGDGATSLGPSFSIAVLYKMTPTISVGLENSRYWIWFDEDFRGLQVDDTSIKFVAGF